MKPLTQVLLILLLSVYAHAQVDVSARGTVRQERMRGYFKAFNSGDAAAMRNYITQNLT